MDSQIPLTFTLTELGVFLSGAYFLYYTSKQNRYLLFTYITAMAYGYIVEALDICRYHIYHYGDFNLMLPGGVPFFVAVTWGMIFVVVMQTSDKLGLPKHIQPLFDGLLAVSLDFCIDPIVVRLKFWIWEEPGPWLGIPLGNFFGWVVVVVVFSYLCRYSNFYFKPESKNLFTQFVLLGCILGAALLIIHFINDLMGLSIAHNEWFQHISLAIVFGGAVILTILHVPTFRYGNSIDYPILILPILMYIYHLFLLVFAVEEISLLLVINSCYSAILGTILFSLPYFRKSKYLTITNE